MKIRVISTVTGKKEKLHFGDFWVVTAKGKLMIGSHDCGDVFLREHNLEKGEYSVQFAFYKNPNGNKWSYEQEVFF